MKYKRTPLKIVERNNTIIIITDFKKPSDKKINKILEQLIDWIYEKR